MSITCGIIHLNKIHNQTVFRKFKNSYECHCPVTASWFSSAQLRISRQVFIHFLLLQVNIHYYFHCVLSYYRHFLQLAFCVTVFTFNTMLSQFIPDAEYLSTILLFMAAFHILYHIYYLIYTWVASVWGC